MIGTILLDAAVYAAEKHGRQTRKGESRKPYITHPLRVAGLLAGEAGVEDEELLAAAVLHDTVEDTGATLADLEARFGRRVRDWVAEVTDDKSLPQQERKRRQVEHAPHLSHGAALIKMADKVDNIRELLADPPAGWSVGEKEGYISWGKEVVAALPPTSPRLRALFDELVASTR